MMSVIRVVAQYVATIIVDDAMRVDYDDADVIILFRAAIIDVVCCYCSRAKRRYGVKMASGTRADYAISS